ncbi:MAG: alanyl-tRNA editing protein [Thermotogae bacterium]|nr:alanyl-tRNA editing protein [Thermotogota bacterium]
MRYTTKVLKCRRIGDSYSVELEKCEFYPDGAGGQLGDRGKVGKSNVLEVIRENGRTILKVDKELESNKEYTVEISENRRFDIAQQHTAQHILSRAFENLFNLQTVGFHMGEEISTIDLNTLSIDWSMVEKAEDLSNEIIWKDLTVEIIFEDFENLEKYDLRKISEKIKKLEKVRLVKIGDFDVNACGGFHVESTGQIGLVKVIHFEKVKGKYTRLEYIAGKRILNYIRTLEGRERKLFEITKASKDDLITKVQKLLDNSKDQKKKITYLVEDLKKKVVLELENNSIVINDIKVYTYSSTTELIEVLASIFQKKEKSIFLGFDLFKNFVIITCNNDELGANDLIKEILKNFEGKGGGSKKRANVVLQKKLTIEDIEKIVNDILDFIKQQHF